MKTMAFALALLASVFFAQLASAYQSNPFAPPAGSQCTTTCTQDYYTGAQRCTTTCR